MKLNEKEGNVQSMESCFPNITLKLQESLPPWKYKFKKNEGWLETFAQSSVYFGCRLLLQEDQQGQLD